MERADHFLGGCCLFMEYRKRAATRKIFKIFRWKGLVVCMLAWGACIVFFGEARPQFAEFEQWITDRPMDIEVDLSKAGEYTTTLRQTCNTAHNAPLCLNIVLVLDEEIVPEQFLGDLLLSVEIQDANGIQMTSVRIVPKYFRRPLRGKSEVDIGGFGGFPIGNYFATIRVERGILEMAGRSQRFIAYYQRCGIEQFPALVSAAVSTGAALLGLVLLFATLPGVIRDYYTKW